MLTSLIKQEYLARSRVPSYAPTLELYGRKRMRALLYTRTFNRVSSPIFERYNLLKLLKVREEERILLLL